LCLRNLRLARRGREPTLDLGALGGKLGATLLRHFQLLLGCLVSLLKLTQPVVVGPHCTRLLQPARYALQPLARWGQHPLVLRDQPVEVGAQAVHTLALDVEARLTQEGAVAHAGLLAREAVLLQTHLQPAHLALDLLMHPFQLRQLLGYCRILPDPAYVRAGPPFGLGRPPPPPYRPGPL